MSVSADEITGFMRKGGMSIAHGAGLRQGREACGELVSPNHRGGQSVRSFRLFCHVGHKKGKAVRYGTVEAR